jgi:hypothetical protein
MHPLRKYIRLLIQEQNKKEKEGEKSKDILGEPDFSPDEDEQEVSGGGVAGVATPIGTGPTYPSKTSHKKESSRS